MTCTLIVVKVILCSCRKRFQENQRFLKKKKKKKEEEEEEAKKVLPSIRVQLTFYLNHKFIRPNMPNAQTERITKNDSYST